MKPVVFQLADIKGVSDLVKKATISQAPIVVSLPSGEELVAMNPGVLDQILYHRACSEAYSKTKV